MLKKLFVLLPLFFFACASAGVKQLDKDVIDSIYVGKTTQREVVAKLGLPVGLPPNDGRPMYLMDDKELRKYLYQQTQKKYSDIPTGNYEVWHYWYMLGHSTFIGRRDVMLNAMIIFNEGGVVYKKFYSDASQATFSPKHRNIIHPDYIELN